MKKIFYTLFFAAFFTSCQSSKNYLERSDEDKALQDAVKKLNKAPNDNDALAAIPLLYGNIQKSHLAKIASYRNSTELASREKIVAEYTDLQDAYGAIINSAAAVRLITPISFEADLFAAKQDAAETYYSAGETSLAAGGRDNAKKGYNFFKKADKYLPGYKDATERMKDAYESAIVNVVINPVEDNSFFFNTGWGNTGYNFSNEYFQNTLVRELQNQSNTRYAAQFFTDWEARRENIRPDWVIDLRLRNINIPVPSRITSTRNVNARIESGKDTSGKPRYETVYAQVTTITESFTARAEMEVNIKDVSTGKNISYRSFNEDYRWNHQETSYTGDSRALSSSDLNAGGGYYNRPNKDEILNELFRKIYPQVKNNILYASDW